MKIHKTKIFRMLAIVFSLVLILQPCLIEGSVVSAAESKKWPDEPFCETYTVWDNGEDEGIVMYQQFGTMRTMKGTILAYCEARTGWDDHREPHHIALKRSEDGGKTWSKTIFLADFREDKCSEDENASSTTNYTGHCYADCRMVQDEETGRIFAFYADNFAGQRCETFYKYSDDDGKTWSKAVDVTYLYDDDPFERTTNVPGPGHGIQLKYGEYKGRMLIVSYGYTAALSASSIIDRYCGLTVIYSDDHGETWHTSVIMDVTNSLCEPRLGELLDGTVVMNCRSQNSERRYLESVDGGITWTDSVLWDSIERYADCDSGFITDNADGVERMLTCHPVGTLRGNLSVYLSYDNGQTWPYSKELWNLGEGKGGTGSQDIIVVDEGVYGILHGTTYNWTDVKFIVFNRSYLFDEADKSELEALVEEVEGLDLDKYTKESVAALAEPLKAAKAVLEKEIVAVTQDEVDAATAKLKEAKNGLLLKRGELEAEIKRAEKLDLSKYTDKTADALKKALETAKKVYNDSDATQQEIDEAARELAARIEDLAEKDAKSDTKSDNKGGFLPGTGDSTKIGVVMLVLLVSAAVIAIVVYKKKKVSL